MRPNWSCWCLVCLHFNQSNDVRSQQPAGLVSAQWRFSLYFSTGCMNSLYVALHSTVSLQQHPWRWTNGSCLCTLKSTVHLLSGMTWTWLDCTLPLSWVNFNSIVGQLHCINKGGTACMCECICCRLIIKHWLLSATAKSFSGKGHQHLWMKEEHAVREIVEAIVDNEKTPFELFTMATCFILEETEAC